MKFAIFIYGGQLVFVLYNSHGQKKSFLIGSSSFFINGILKKFWQLTFILDRLVKASALDSKEFAKGIFSKILT